MPIDIVSLGFIVALTLPQFRAKGPPFVAALALGVACGLALLMKFNFGVGAFLSSVSLLGLRAVLSPRPIRALELRALAIFIVAFLATSAAAFASLDYGVALAAGLAAVALGCAIALSRPSLDSKAVRIVGAIAAASCLCLVSASFRSFVGTSVQVAAGYSGAMSFDGPSSGALVRPRGVRTALSRIRR